MRVLLPVWLEERKHTVSAKTFVSDAAIVRLTPTSLQAMSVGAVTSREVSRTFVTFVRGGLAEASVRRFRDSLSAFFAWAVRERMILLNPVAGTKHATAFKRTLDWAVVGEGRRIHDLRHTAACLWLARGVDPVTVQAWMGHASIATTNLYLHHLGTAADQAGLARLNALGHTGGTPHRSESK